MEGTKGKGEEKEGNERGEWVEYIKQGEINVPYCCREEKRERPRYTSVPNLSIVWGVKDGGREAKMPTLKILSNVELWE
jgi:hypothetical protein